MSIESEIDRLTAAKNSIASSLQTMGIAPPEGTTLDQYAAQLAAIAAAAPWLPLAGGTMTGDIQMGGSRVTGVGEPQEDTDAARKGDLAGKLDAPSGGTTGQILEKTATGTQWADKPSGGISQSEADARYLQLSGGTMTGALALPGNPTSDNQAANKAYVDSKLPKPASVTLTASSWSSNTQTVTVSGVKATGQNVRLSPVTKADADAWAAAGCWCTAQAENALTFTCDTVPAQDIQLNVEMQEVQS